MRPSTLAPPLCDQETTSTVGPQTKKPTVKWAFLIAETAYFGCARTLGYEATNHTCCSSGLIGEPRHPLSVQAQK